MEDLIESVTRGNPTEVKVVVTAQLGPPSAAELDAREEAREERLEQREERREEP